MRKLLVLTAMFGLLAQSPAQEPGAKQPGKKDADLKVGDPAPAIKVTKWMQGAEIKAFGKGQTYVVEFWATWCWPCIVMMPHLGELQKLYKDKGVTFIGFAAKDPNNTMEKVSAVVEKRGPSLGYTFAYADDRETYDAWMQASGNNGIPCCFVIDKEGKIAFIGHPMYLNAVLPKVLAGKWGERDVNSVAAIQDEVAWVHQAAEAMDPEVFLKAVAAFEAEHPELVDVPYFRGPRIGSLLKAKRFDEAKKLAEAFIAKGVKTSDDRLLFTAAGALGTGAGGDKELLALSLKAAEAGLKIAGDKDWIGLLAVAESHFAAGDKKKAQEFGAKAVAAADTESAGIKKHVDGEVKKFRGKKD